MKLDLNWTSMQGGYVVVLILHVVIRVLLFLIFCPFSNLVISFYVEVVNWLCDSHIFIAVWLPDRWVDWFVFWLPTFQHLKEASSMCSMTHSVSTMPEQWAGAWLDLMNFYLKNDCLFIFCLTQMSNLHRNNSKGGGFLLS